MLDESSQLHRQQLGPMMHAYICHPAIDREPEPRTAPGNALALWMNPARKV
jgi:hypothetical protein